MALPSTWSSCSPSVPSAPPDSPSPGDPSGRHGHKAIVSTAGTHRLKRWSHSFDLNTAPGGSTARHPGPADKPAGRAGGWAMRISAVWCPCPASRASPKQLPRQSKRHSHTPLTGVTRRDFPGSGDPACCRIASTRNSDWHRQNTRPAAAGPRACGGCRPHPGTGRPAD